ncbi:MAG TPA: outer membrane protein assembly factor BamE [Bdellovibrionales bacterium]|nr:outer membrane protein assembly factor BamE [Bdellovibrionales bacterium]
MRLTKLLFVISIAAVLTACQTPAERFTKVKPGMSKDEVLEAAGNPTFSRRWQSKDRWIYTFDNRSAEREVHFENGKATYVGGTVTPPVSAAEQDRLNSSGVKAWESELVKETLAPAPPEPEAVVPAPRKPKYEEIN